MNTLLPGILGVHLLMVTSMRAADDKVSAIGNPPENSHLPSKVLAATSNESLRERAATSLRRAVEFFRNEVAVGGSYLWQYSEDLSKREGEGVATATQGWVQPPGTPSVGLAYLTAYEATAEACYREAAQATAQALVRGQLLSGGWTYSIDIDPAARAKFAYREGGKKTARNVSTLDDDTTQSAVRFLLRADQALGFQDERIHASVSYALESLLQAQYPNGAWPQGYDQFPDPRQFPVKPASHPETWPRTWPGSQRYWQRYTLNDNVLADMITTLFEAERICGGPKTDRRFQELGARCRAAAEKAGDFLLLAQLPEPQPAWAQQYDFDMHPVWARQFEPPAVTGGESQGALRILLRLYRETGQAKYLEPIPRALRYLRRSRLPDGQLARFYELPSNRPLYFTRDYQLTYDDSDVPTHYAFKVSDGTKAIEEELAQLQKNRAPAPDKPARRPALQTDSALAARVLSVIAAQDARGRWVEDGGLRYQRPKDPTVRVIRSETFIRNVATLSRYLAVERERPQP